MDLQMTRGTDFGPVTVNLTDKDDVAVDLTGAVITAKLELANGLGSVITFGTDIPSPASQGKFVFALTAVVTATLDPGPELYDWNLWLTKAGVVIPLYFGKVTVQGQVL